jgi:hypothetical protein
VRRPASLPSTSCACVETGTAQQLVHAAMEGSQPAKPSVNNSGPCKEQVQAGLVGPTPTRACGALKNGAAQWASASRAARATNTSWAGDVGEGGVRACSHNRPEKTATNPMARRRVEPQAYTTVPNALPVAGPDWRLSAAVPLLRPISASQAHLEAALPTHLPPEWEH